MRTNYVGKPFTRDVKKQEEEAKRIILKSLENAVEDLKVEYPNQRGYLDSILSTGESIANKIVRAERKTVDEIIKNRERGLNRLNDSLLEMNINGYSFDNEDKLKEEIIRHIAFNDTRTDFIKSPMRDIALKYFYMPVLQDEANRRGIRSKTSIGGNRYRKSKKSPLRYIVTNPKHYNYGRTIEIYPEEKDEHGFILVRIYENGNLIKEQYDPESHLDIQTDNQYSYIRKDKPSKYTRSKIRFGVLVSFHSTNRGLKFEGEKPFSQIMSEQSAYLYTDDNGITRDDTGRIVSEDDPNGDTGELEFERSDRYYTKRVYEYGDLSDYEIDAIKKYRYISDDLKDIID